MKKLCPVHGVVNVPPQDKTCIFCDIEGNGDTLLDDSISNDYDYNKVKS